MSGSDKAGESRQRDSAIACQRGLFDLPDDVIWLNCAQHSPALNAVHEAGMGGLALKRHPWRLGPRQYQDDVERLRGTFASLIGASAEEIALVPSASYALSIAARNLPLREGERILVLADQFPSNVYPWRDLARRCGGEVVTLERPEDGDWTRAISLALDERVAILATPNYHWTDGSLVDLSALAPKVRDVGAALVLDLSQSWGVVPLDLSEIRPDFAVTVGYKWLLGPYRFTFFYVAPHRQEGEPIEQAWSARVSSADSSRLTEYQDGFLPGARRYDVGERGDYIAVPMVQAALDQILEWGVPDIARSLQPMVSEIAHRAERLGIGTVPEEFRAPHFTGLSLPRTVPGDLPQRLAAKGIFVSVRGESLRISPYLYNEMAEVDRLFEAIEAEI